MCTTSSIEPHQAARSLRSPEERRGRRASADRTRVAIGRWLVVAGLLAIGCGAEPSDTESVSPSSGAGEEIVEWESLMPGLLGAHICTCGCGMELPGSPSGRGCFGCSVGKAEVTYMRDHLAAGGSVRDLLFALQERVLLEVYADYTDPRLARIWSRAERIMAEFGQHRLVMRSTARSQDAERALRLAECTRQIDLFTAVQERLLGHPGPWDLEALLLIADSFRLDRVSLARCIETINLSPQIEKDRSHAKKRNLRRFPALVLNGERVPTDERRLREAIRAIVFESAI